MMKQLKLACRMLKYAYGIKMNLIMMVFFTLLGAVIYLLNTDSQMFGLGGLYLMLSAMFIIQIWYSLNSSNFLRTSSYKKAAETSIPTILSVGGMLLMYTLMLVITLIRGAEPAQINALLYMAFDGCLILLLCGVTYKYFVVSLLVFFFCYFAAHVGFMVVRYQLADLLFPVPIAAVLSYGLILLGGIGEYLLSLLFYKKSVSKLAQGAALRKYL